MGLYFTNQSKTSFVSFADAGYLSDPHTGRSQTGYLFTSRGITISWRLVKQTITATSSNHAEILAIHEASQECIWLRTVIQHIRGSCGFSSGDEGPTILHEDNAACIAQLKEGYIKGDRTKHILPNGNCSTIFSLTRSVLSSAPLQTLNLIPSRFLFLRNHVAFFLLFFSCLIYRNNDLTRYRLSPSLYQNPTSESEGIKQHQGFETVALNPLQVEVARPMDKKRKRVYEDSQITQFREILNNYKPQNYESVMSSFNGYRDDTVQKLLIPMKLLPVAVRDRLLGVLRLGIATRYDIEVESLNQLG
ncbi:uncharacterized protein LOC118479634 [Helianthus annuus]|uniref:uncharacterized protein LOC118479634 n=1 Tax=Helianthus annuus TaxID=4232 RepID=UPI001652E96A|nr:uncharacterized protein LOC118479634 [Helianthus annuus]